MNWRQWFEMPPSWRALRAFNAAGLIFCIGLALVQDNWWIMMFDAFIAGTCASGIYHATKMIRMTELFDQAQAAFASMANINKALVEGNMVLAAQLAQEDDIPIAPNRLH